METHTAAVREDYFLQQRGEAAAQLDLKEEEECMMEGRSV